MKQTLYMLLIGAAAMTACVKDELVNTPHPDKGAVVVKADFSERTTACPSPTDYTLTIGGESCTAPAGREHCHPALFAPQTHPLTAYNACEKISADGATLKVTAAANGLIDPLPGYLFTARQQITVIADDTLRVNLPMVQRTRDLHFELTVTEGDPALIERVTGKLDGVAGAFDLAAQQTTGGAKTASLAFTRTGDKLTSDARLLGILGPTQTLTLEITFTDARTQTVEVDLTQALSAFNGAMTTGFEVTGDLETPIGMDATATITGWNDVDGDPVEAT